MIQVFGLPEGLRQNQFTLLAHMHNHTCTNVYVGAGLCT